VTLTFFGTLLAGAGAGFGQLLAVVGVASHESGMQRRDVRDVATEPSTLFHLPRRRDTRRRTTTDPSGFIADLDAFALFLAQMIDLETVSASDIARHRTRPF